MSGNTTTLINETTPVNTTTRPMIVAFLRTRTSQERARFLAAVKVHLPADCTVSHNKEFAVMRREFYNMFFPNTSKKKMTFLRELEEMDKPTE